MELGYLFKGIAMGLLGSIPLGPIGVLCIQRTLNRKFKSGFISGMGAASADTIFAIAAMFFLTIVMSFVEKHIPLLTVIGGIIVVAMGVTIMNRKPEVNIRRNRIKSRKLFSDYISTFLLTLTNPAYILVFVALFTIVGGKNMSPTFLESTLVVIGVFIGASCWWASLAAVINIIRKRFRPRHIVVVNKIAGITIAVLGALAILSVFVKLPVSGVETLIQNRF